MIIERIGIVTERVCYMTLVFVLGATYQSVKTFGVTPEAVWVTAALSVMALAIYTLSERNDRSNHPAANV